MANIIINIPAQYTNRVLSSVQEIFPIPQIANPEFDPDDPLETDPPLINQFTQVAWVKKILEDYLRSLVKRGESKVAIDDAKARVNVPDEVVGD
jgi:hypothetical protein